MKAVVISLGLLCAGLTVPLRADPRFKPPVPVRTTAPVFPAAMRHDGVSGFVLVNCLIDARGNVSDLKVEKATADAFVQPALDALKKWKFKPAQRGGDNVPIRVSIPFRFTINDS